MKRIILFVEGEGEAIAAPCLVNKILVPLNAYSEVFIDSNTFRVRDVHHLFKDNYKEWKRKLEAALLRRDVGGIILLLDGDSKNFDGQPFCAKTAATKFAEIATEVGAGAIFSVAVVFACREYESWFIAGIESLAGKSFPESCISIPNGITAPNGDLEESPRNAKGWITENSSGSYEPPLHQVTLTQKLDWQLVRDRPMRSFIRLESAVKQVVEAIQTDTHVSTPVTTIHQ